MIIQIMFLPSLTTTGHHDDYRICKQKRNKLKLLVSILFSVIPLIFKDNLEPLYLMATNTVILCIVAVVDFHGDQQIPVECEKTDLEKYVTHGILPPGENLNAYPEDDPSKEEDWSYRRHNLVRSECQSNLGSL